MLYEAGVEEATPIELVALARLVSDPEIAPPPHLRKDLEAKGWVETKESGPLITGAGRDLVELSQAMLSSR